MGALSDLIQRTEQTNYDSGLDFELDILPRFCDALGIDEDFLYYSPNLGEGLRPDGLIQVNINRDPWLVVEAKLSNNPNILRNAQNQIRRYLDYTEAEFGVIIGVGILTLVGRDGEVISEANSPNDDEVDEIGSILVPPDTLRTRSETDSPERESTDERVSHSNYNIELGELEEALEAVDGAETNQEKGDTFEELANILFEAIPYLTVRSRNLRTHTGEVDLVIEYQGADNLTIFDEWSRFLLVECKNWSDSVGVSQVRNFKGKMDKAQIDIGIIFARRGVSGDEGADAIRWIHDYFQREGRMILVIGDSEFSRLLEGESFYEILDEAMYQRRFDFD